MSKEQKRRKYQSKKKRKKSKELPSDEKIKNLVVPIIESKGAASALKRAILTTIKE